MVRATIRTLTGEEKKIHWPCDYTPQEMQLRACMAFRFCFLECKATFAHDKGTLNDWEMPFFAAQRHENVALTVAFNKRTASEKDDVEGTINDGDVSSGYTTPSEIAAEVRRMDSAAP